ncbi:hypothetical protein QUB80_05430 [Chlorogloeopsis sp. ULAP01]|uniref:hypothetical protein n=1 Tax=Chlorogloeopsis sp. ULAP01 TaxID=3056483 RepID=UPI0025AA4BC8|nr:hypothetical protein [Chlorogloeopsis sp. ULAP01]MDM9380140.1 hypothetical protein [Chlorogloeopsis sp. ULAP01]
MRTKTFAMLMSMPSVLAITGLNFATQVLPNTSLTQGSVLSNSQQDGDLYTAKKIKQKDVCRPVTCDGSPQ